MTEPSKPRYPLTRDGALRLRALGRINRAQARLEPNLYYRHQQMTVANAAIRKAEEVLGEECRKEEGC